MRSFIFSPLFGLLFLFIFGCSSSEQAEVELKISSVLPPDHPTSVALRFFKDELERESEGRIHVRIFTGGQLGNTNDTIELSRAGSIELVQCSAVHIAPFKPAINALGMPFLFRDREHRLAALDGAAGDTVRDMLGEMDLRLLCVFDAGSRNLMTKKGPINTPEQLAGMKIRVMPSQMMVDSINALGASAVAMNQGNVYTALQTGVLDGWENNPPTALNFRMYETGCTYFAWSRHLAIPDFLIMSGRSYERLPDDLRTAVERVASATEAQQRELWYAAESAAVEQLKEAGMSFNKVDTRIFAKRVEPLYAASREKYGAAFSQLLDDLRR